MKINQKIKKFIYALTALFLSLFVFFNESSVSFALSATALTKAQEERIELQKAMPVDTNNVVNWPQGPIVSAESAILMEAGTGAILYSKNIHLREYPASTTKILTTLIAYENSSPDEIVDFSYDAVFSVPRNSNHIAMSPGDTLTMEDSLKAILIRSANEVAYAVAEHISGSFDAFAALMNEKAAELGCVESHFVNPNGLPDENHYTSAYDLAMIGRQFFANEYLASITLSPMLRIQKPAGEYLDANQMKLIPGSSYGYPYLVGVKTGYTEDARASLVACAEKDGLKLICVVMKDENPAYYEDATALFNYGFANFEKINVSETETKYNIASGSAFYSDNDIFGSSEPILSLNKDAYVVMPKTADFSLADSVISYDNLERDQAALITYSYHEQYIGSVSVDFSKGNSSYAFSVPTEEKKNTPKVPSYVFVNIFVVLSVFAGIAAFIGLILLIRHIVKNIKISRRSNRKLWRLNQLKRYFRRKSGR